MKRAIRPAILVLVLLGAFALGQLACGGSSSTPPTAPTMSGTPTPAPPGY